MISYEVIVVSYEVVEVSEMVLVVFVRFRVVRVLKVVDCELHTTIFTPWIIFLWKNVYFPDW